MLAYIIRRIFSMIPTLFGVSVIVFFMLHLTPGDPAELLMGERATEKALEEIREHLGRYPKDAPAWYSLGLALKNAGKTEDAVSAFQKTLSLDPFHAKACNNLGVAFLERGDIGRAQEAFLKAIDMNPGHSKAYFNLAQIALRRGENDEALSYLQKGLKYEDNPTARRLLEELQK